MGIVKIRLPDVGEGVAEAELTGWSVAVGDLVQEDDILAEIMTDKAAVEIPSEVSGKIVWLSGEAGDILAIGSDLAHIEVEGITEDEGGSPWQELQESIESVSGDTAPLALENSDQSVKQNTPAADTPLAPVSGPSTRDKPVASPAVRRRARDAGISLTKVKGTGPAGRVSHNDLDLFLNRSSSVTQMGRDTSVTEKKIIGLRRRIAEKMALSKSRIPHITIVEEIDLTDLENLRDKLNVKNADSRGKLTLLPFLVGAIKMAVKEQPVMNAHYDDDANVLRQFGGIHCGIATQTENGLVVPVIRHCETLGLWETASEIRRLSASARAGGISRDELTGSSITISSLGPLGAIATTPIINHPEVSIIGVNKMQTRPVWDGSQFVPKKMMNISASFDHRVIDGWDAALFVQQIKTLLETPAFIFLEK